MASAGYVVFQLRANVFRRPDEPRPLSDLDGRGVDFLKEVTKRLGGIEGELRTEEQNEQAYRIEEYAPIGRGVMITGLVGPYGTPGHLVHLDTGDDQAFDERSATMVRLRAMLVVPAESYDALLLCERRSLRHLRNALERGVFVELGREHGVKIGVETHVDYEAWERFLEAAEVYKITTVYRSTRLEDMGPDRRRSGDLRIVAEGNVASRVGRSLFTPIRRMLAQPGHVAAVNIDDVPELAPRGGNYERERIELQVGDDEAKRTIVVEKERLPQFVYPIDRALTDRALQDLWTDHASSLLSAQGITMPDRWWVER